MDFGSNRLYEFELWDMNGNRIADISPLAADRTYTLKRNEAELLTFSLNLYAFETYCASINADPHTILAPYQTDVKVKRNGQYLFGVQVVDLNFDLPQDFAPPGEGAGTQSSADFRVTVTATGYLNLFKDRYVTKTYAATDAANIAWDLLSTTQAQTNGSVGVTHAASPYLTGVNRDRTYTRDNVKDKVQELTQLIDGKFDFGFSWDKKFQTYSQIGARRGDISLVYGGAGSNVAGFSLDRSGLNLYNVVYGLGSGFGPDQLLSTQSDSASEVNYYVREKISQFNSVVDQPTLNQNTLADLKLSKDTLELPVVTITTREVPANNFISVGDRIPLAVNNHTWLNNINGLYRVEQMVVTIDENDFETGIELTFDSYGVDPNEQPAG